MNMRLFEAISIQKFRSFVISRNTRKILQAQRIDDSDPLLMQNAVLQAEINLSQLITVRTRKNMICFLFNSQIYFNKCLIFKINIYCFHYSLNSLLKRCIIYPKPQLPVTLKLNASKIISLLKMSVKFR